MLDLGELVGRGFERLIRWAYPGVLFVTLLALGKPRYFDWWFGLQHDRIIVALAVVVVSSFLIYSLERHVWNELETCFLDRWGLAAFSRRRPRRSRTRIGRWYRWRLARRLTYLNRLSRSTERRFGYIGDARGQVERFSDYMVNRWAVTHAMGATFWTFLLMYFWAEETSLLRQWQAVLWAVAILSMLLGHLPAVVVLERIERRYFQRPR